jgi:KDO2-lipid IV(A) lauroyltransferase
MFTIFAERNPDGRYTATFQRIPSDDLRPDKDGIAELTRRHVAALEEAIRKRPDLWVWQHRRWKR